MDSLGLGHAIQPFWQRIPKFFAYPSKPAVLMHVVGYALIGAFSTLPIIGIGAALLALIASLRYCHRVLYHSALGRSEPPAGRSSQEEFRDIFLKQMAVFFVLFSLPGFTVGLTHSWGAGWAVLIFVQLALPASIMVLAIEESFFAAINPLKLLGATLNIGAPYLLLWVFLMLFSAGSSQVSGLLPASLPFEVGLFLYYLVSIYFAVAMFHLMGYVIYQYHEPLGFTIDQNTARDLHVGATGSVTGSASVLPPPDRAQILITEGNLAEAATELESRIRENPDDLKLHDRYNRLMIAQGNKENGSPHADLYMGKLIAANQASTALEVYRRCVTPLGNVDIKDGEDTLTLAGLAYERKQFKLALPLLTKFAQRFPAHARIPDAELLTAKLLSEYLGRDDMAKKIVEQLQHRFPDHATRPQMDRLLARLEAMRQPRPLANQPK